MSCRWMRMRTSVPWSDGFRCPTKRLLSRLCLRACFLGSQRQGGASCSNCSRWGFENGNQGRDWLRCAASSLRLDEHTTRGGRERGEVEAKVPGPYLFKSAGPGVVFKIQGNVGWRTQRPQKRSFVGDLGVVSSRWMALFLGGSSKAGPDAAFAGLGRLDRGQGTAGQGNSVRNLNSDCATENGGVWRLVECPFTEQSASMTEFGCKNCCWETRFEIPSLCPLFGTLMECGRRG